MATVLPVEAIDNNIPVLAAGDRVELSEDFRSHLHTQKISSVASSTINSRQCPIEAIQREIDRGNPLWYLVSEPIVLSKYPDAPKEETKATLNDGDRVFFEGKVLQIEATALRDAVLVDVTDEYTD